MFELHVYQTGVTRRGFQLHFYVETTWFLTRQFHRHQPCSLPHSNLGSLGEQLSTVCHLYRFLLSTSYISDAQVKFIGFSENLLNWISSFLKGRKQMVKMSLISDELLVFTGVLQDTHYSPLLFSLLVKDLLLLTVHVNVYRWFEDIQVIGPDFDRQSLQTNVDRLVQS